MVNQTEPQIITLDEMMRRIHESVEGKFDVVVAIERGGVLPGYLAARKLDIPFTTVTLRFRDDNHQPIYDSPKVVRPVEIDLRGRRVLLTDDVANSGATLRAAMESLRGAQVTTLVISGTADISLFGPHNRCIRWPWER